MPELPEVETVRRGLAPVMEGRRIERLEARRPDLRFPLPDSFAKRLTGRSILRLGRRAKYLLIYLDDENVLISHLGMSGRFTIYPPEGTQEQGNGRHDHIVFHMEGGVRVVYTDHRRFGYMDLVPQKDLATCRHLNGLGPEPNSNEFSSPALGDALRGKRSPIKSALLDQRVVAGLGNIYVCEALYRAGLSPRRLAYTVAGKGPRPTARIERLVPAIRGVIAEAIEAGGSTLRDYARTDGELGYFQHAFGVYGREGEACLTPHCTARVARIVQAGRSSFFCPACQR